jgi:hypothetical protein
MRPELPYTRMPGGLRGFVRKSSLWEGSDHLLLVRGTRFAEEYRRFYYRDIEALVVQKCARTGSIGWWLVNLTACAVAVPMVFVPGFPKAPTGAIALLTVLLLLVRLVIAVRYSCRCVVQTAVSREELPSLQRTWTAKKALGRLREKIAEVQGVLSEDAGGLLASTEAEATVAPGNASDKARSQTPPTRPNAARSVNLAIAAFALLLVDAAQAFSVVTGPAAVGSLWSSVLIVALVITTGGLTVFSLLGTNGLRSLRKLRALLLTALIFEGLDIYFGMVLGSLYSIEKGVVDITLTLVQAWPWLMRVDGGLCALLGGIGLIFVLLNWETLRRENVSAV